MSVFRLFGHELLSRGPGGAVSLLMTFIIHVWLLWEHSGGGAIISSSSSNEVRWRSHNGLTYSVTSKHF